jgi:predicted ATPase/DNA-binding winged helix-turn-helix (wHTH) protein
MSDQYRFGDFKLLPAERLLFRRGAELALTARAFELLVAFVERAGQLLAKDDLLQRVWAGVVVEENNLAVQVGVLRKLLGAEAIATVPGYGYRFALEVIDVGAAGPAEATARGRGNLPLRLPSLIGREAELAEAATLLQAHPLLTICGGPGFGKTRLAQELALRLRDQHADGAWWVDLTLLREGESPAAALARTLGVPLAEGADPLLALTGRLASLAMLIVLDNAEHRVHDVSALAEALVRHTAKLRVVVTSQVPLRAAGERLFRLAPLPLDDAMRLLAERAGSAPWQGDAQAQAAAVCRELDGNALAIELAAARVEGLGLEGLAARLHQRLTLLAPDASVQTSRRNALATALDWSHELLGERERRVLRRLGVFPGSFSLEGAALVLADETLPAARVVDAVLSLVDRSLVSVERGAHQRFRLLETTRLFALERLAAEGEVEAAQARLCTGLRWLLDDAYEESWQSPPAQWIARYGPELPALWAALGWAAEHDVESAVALFGAATPLWRELKVLTVAREHARALSERLTDTMKAKTRARFWLGFALCHTMIHPGLARAAAERAAELYRGMADVRGEYLALIEYTFNWRVDGPEARAALARAKAIENPGWPASVIERGLTSEAVILLTSGRFDEVRRCYIEALEVCRRANYELGVRKVLLNQADLERAAGHVDEAVRLGQAVRELLHDDQGSDTLVTVMSNLFGALIEQGNHEAAREVALECRRRVGRWALEECGWIWLDSLALLHLHDGRITLAARLAGASDREFELHGQFQRQPNEAADRAALAAGLAAHLPAAEIERLHAEGQRMSAHESVAIALDLERKTP